MDRALEARVTIVAVTYNSRHIIGQMLSNVVDSPGIEIIVVDNDSTDGTAHYLQESYPNVILLKNADNQGFARAVNRGVKSASAPNILLLNPDAIIDVSSVKTLASVLRDDPSISIVAPRIHQSQGRLSVLEAGRSPDLWRMFCHWSGLSRLAHRWPAFEGTYLVARHLRDSRDVDWVSGACMLVRASTWSDLGGLSERWFMYAEDVDLCLRARDEGLRVRLELKATAEHVIGGSSQSIVNHGLNPVVRSDWVVNLFELYLARSSTTRLRAVAWKGVVVTGLLSRSLAYLVKSWRTDGERRLGWRRESYRFLIFARDLTKKPGK